ncbi:MAG: hypothetical protein HYX61_08735 [Gammaproteobacteria bacterium]|jgi:hypothetical protein|nr:hypothetical protein [Gammaproteobacteria bacterium]
MPKISLELLDEFLKHYALEAPFIYPNSDENNNNVSVSSTIFEQHESHQKNTCKILGSYASDFIQHANQRFTNGEISPPITLRTVQAIYTYFDQLNIDLIGNLNGNAYEKQRAKEWNTYWHNVVAEFQREGKKFNQEELTKVKNDILTAYRQKIITMCNFHPKGQESDEMDEMRAQEYLLSINQLYDSLTAYEAYDFILKKLINDFENDLWLDVQSLSRLLNTTNHSDYVKKFDEMISRKTVEFLGSTALNRIFSEVTNDKEFLKQLPLLLEKGEKLKHFITHFPDKEKRDKLLTASIYEIFNGEQNEFNHAIQNKYFNMIQNLMETN